MNQCLCPTSRSYKSLCLPSDIVITFDPSTYSVTEGGSVQVFLVADRDFSEPFNVTVTSDNTEGERRN